MNRIIRRIASREAQKAVGQLIAYGKVSAVSAGPATTQRVNVYINGASTATPNVPVCSRSGTLVVGDEVILIRKDSVDMFVIDKKPM
ncbi:hypothetical protein C7459_11791 [Tumebacillus permanentifrigoris]|uniref:Uncharacterized protein n=2 Tax=Tumebacillus permanentifrigoris TaxID=378543 RepID=A0A316D8Z7_9BACL|nr:hypothetical protein C7459_11791 [Tumebacillus permanentifrigoris]